MPPHSRGPSVDPDYPGAGTLFVQAGQEIAASSSKRGSLSGSSRSRSRTPVRFRPSSASRSRERRKKVQEQASRRWPPVWTDAQVLSKLESSTCAAADALLERGIGDYTLLPFPDGLLGRGKFSTVYKVTGLDGKPYALKHTPLYPHHPLIAARLLREPTLLAQLDPHPCLVGVEGWIRTEGHFYLIEQYAATHIPLLAHPLPLRPTRAAYILDQLVSVVRDCMHAGRVCHRDLKPENILVDVETGDVVVLDLGLATQFSASEPKLTTCCGSPAFHSPEIVNALNHPPGSVTYYGPELDIWCIALTLLSLLLSSRYPLGASHRSRRTMAIRAMDRLRQLDEEYPPRHPGARWPLNRDEHLDEANAWVRVRGAMRGFLDVDGDRRMERFRRYAPGEKWERRLTEWRLARQAEGEDGVGGGEGHKEKEKGKFKQLSFVKGDIKYTLPLHIVPDDQESGLGIYQVEHSGSDRRSSSNNRTPTPTARISTVSPSASKLVLANPTNESDRRVLSYLKYLLRTHGILYHCVVVDPMPLLQLVLPLPPAPDPTPAETSAPVPVPAAPSGPWLSSLNPFRRARSANPAGAAGRSVSVPAALAARSTKPPAHGTRTQPEVIPEEKDEAVSYLRCFIQIQFQHPQAHAGRPPLSRRSTGSKTTHAAPGSSKSNRASTSGSSSSRLSSAPVSPRSTSVPLASASTFSVAVETHSRPSPTGEHSLAVASLHQALAHIAQQSPSPPGVVKGALRDAHGETNPASASASPTSGGRGSAGLQMTLSPHAETDTGESTPLATEAEATTSTSSTPKPTRPSINRAMTSPRLGDYRQTSMSTAALPPLSPALTLSPVSQTPMYTMSPLSRQVSPDIDARRPSGPGEGGPHRPSVSSRTVSASSSTSASRSASISSASSAARTPRLKPLSRASSRAPAGARGAGTSTPPELEVGGAAAGDKSSSNSASTSTSTSAFSPSQPDDPAQRTRNPRRAASHASTPRSTHAQLIQALTTLQVPPGSVPPSAASTSASSTSTHLRRVSSRRPEKRPSLVIVHISDARAVEALRAALDVPHDHPVSPVVIPARDKGKGRAVDMPASRANGEQEGDEVEVEEERGRPRSREDTKLLGLGFGTGSTASTGADVAPPVAPGSRAQNGDTSASASAIVAGGYAAVTDKRETSAGKRILDFLGLGFGEHGEMQVGRGRQGRPGRAEPELSPARAYGRRESARTASAPPISKDIFG